MMYHRALEKILLFLNPHIATLADPIQLFGLGRNARGHEATEVNRSVQD